MNEIYNCPNECWKRKELRNNMPKAEIIVWSRLKGKKLGGLKFRRQHSIGCYVVDFFCPSLKLAIEIDGDSHFEEGASEYDLQRQRAIEQFGIRFLRFTNIDVYENLDEVLEAILDWKKQPLPSDFPSPFPEW